MGICLDHATKDIALIGFDRNLEKLVAKCKARFPDRTFECFNLLVKSDVLGWEIQNWLIGECIELKEAQIIVRQIGELLVDMFPVATDCFSGDAKTPINIRKPK